MNSNTNSTRLRVVMALLAALALAIAVGARLWWRDEPAAAFPAGAAAGVPRELEVPSPADLPPGRPGEFDFSGTGLSDEAWHLAEPELEPAATAFPPVPGKSPAAAP